MTLAIAIDNSKTRSDFFANDVWLFSELGVKTPLTKSDYQLNFSGIKQLWLKEAAKKFIHLTSLTRSHGAIANYVTTLSDLSESIIKYGQEHNENAINRELIMRHITDLKVKGLAPATRKKKILNIKLFLELCSREGWLDVANPSIIYSEDIPRVPKAAPRFIPESVMTQLNSNIEMLDSSVMRLIIVLQECGMRITEIATLTRDCIITDNDGDKFLCTHQEKMNKDHTIPIASETYNVIKVQVSYVDDAFGTDCKWLFPVEHKNRLGKRNRNAGEPYKTKTIIAQLNSVAQRAEIRGEDGQIYHFTTHKFRHTVGTRMINNGVPQHIVQRYLGHETPNMTSTYAHVMDSTMKREFAKFKGSMVDVAGNVVDEESVARDISQGADNVDAQWLKRHISAQALPNGLCAMPVVQSCDKANACLTCGNFRTDARYLDQHKEQLERTCSILDTAKQNGWTRQIEMNEKLKQNLLNIIKPLESQNDA